MKARYVASAKTPESLPRLGLVEVAFAGRSNVGKSSVLGAVLGQPKLVRTSRTPGRTQALNLFVLEEQLALVDLPGYGFAKLPKAQRAELEGMLRRYFESRPQLSGVVLLVDARREEVSELDRLFAGWVLARSPRLLLVITKIDLVPKNRRQHVTSVIERELGVPRGTAILCSASTGEGIASITKSLFQLESEMGAAGDQ